MLPLEPLQIMMDHHVTVIIPTYNRAHMIPRAVESARAQTYKDLDIIVVDDGSTDETPQVMEALVSDKVRYLRLELNAGAQAARNAGVRAAAGGLIAFLDSDDEWDPRKIELQVAKIKTSPPDVGLIYCGIRRIDKDGRRVHDHVPRHRGRIFEALLQHNVIGGMSVALTRADVLREVGLFDERLRARQDLDMWLRIARRYEIDYVPEKLVIYHVHRGRTSENKSSRLQGTLALLGKLHDDLKTRPKVRATHYYALARLYGQIGEVHKERRYLRRSLKATRRFRTFIRLLLALFKWP